MFEERQNITRQYLQALEESDYQGDIFTDTTTRLIHATDNSIYQVIPEAVVVPRTPEDIQHILTLGAQYSGISFMARGGGTGTNGQSLNNCIIVDTSKHLTEILEINVEEGWVRVQPGVVLEELNRALKAYNLFLPIHISPSKSATLGGMVSTDACGKGSRAYGKTSEYILDMRCVLASGQTIETHDYNDPALKKLISEHYEDAVRTMPNLPRGVSGYNVQAYDPATDALNINKLIAGSEGSLAFVTEITLRVLPKPAHRIMFCVAYDNFDTALRHVPALLEQKPVAIETIDDRILELARGDILWRDVQGILPDNIPPETIKAFHFVELEAHEQTELQQKEKNFETFLEESAKNLGHVVLRDAKSIADAWALRSKCVGLLGNMEGIRRPLPFVEDTAVPVENLPDYIIDLKALFAKHNLESGAFGHVDAGCLHVRPALDLRQTEDEALIRSLSDEVVQLLQKHKGVLWGEHGKGMRAEYISALLGTPYYEAMQAIKMHFDPHNRLNPGKIATPKGENLLAIDEVPLRGQFDRQIDEGLLSAFEKSVQCNGNAQCFSAMPDDTMCPSYKVTRDRRHSPKGRAGLLREWLRLKSTSPREARAFEPQLYEVMSGCLACKACTSVCPIHVNIPDMKSAFLEQYFKRRMRSLRDYVVAYAETLAHWQSYLPFTMPGLFGLVDVPKPSYPNIRSLIKSGGFEFATPEKIAVAKKPVLIVQDAYTSTYNAPVVMATLELIRKLGFEPFLLPFRQSGKSWHVMGFLQKFKRIAAQNTAYYKSFDAPLVGVDPAITLTYRDEYKGSGLNILLLHEWLEQNISDEQKLSSGNSEAYKLFLHCTESTMLPGAKESWRNIFKQFGMELEPVQTGCCGMAGAYGHMQEHRDKSLKLYEMSWSEVINEQALVTGYSCRSQVKRCDDFVARHPVEILNDCL